MDLRSTRLLAELARRTTSGAALIALPRAPSHAPALAHAQKRAVVRARGGRALSCREQQHVAGVALLACRARSPPDGVDVRHACVARKTRYVAPVGQLARATTLYRCLAPIAARLEVPDQGSMRYYRWTADRLRRRERRSMACGLRDAANRPERQLFADCTS